MCERELAGKRAGKKTLEEKNPHPQNAKSFLLLVLHHHATINSTSRRGIFLTF